MNKTMYMRRLAAKVKTNFNMFDLPPAVRRKVDTSYMSKVVLKKSVKKLSNIFGLCGNPAEWNLRLLTTALAGHRYLFHNALW